MARRRVTQITGVALALAAALLASGVGAAQSPPQRRQCLSPAETLTVIAENSLARPRDTLSRAASEAGAEPLGARLCRWDEDFVYEITLLRSDGRVLRVFVDATSGKVVGSPAAN